MSATIKTLEPLLAPQERLDRLIASTFRRFGPRIVDLSYANPYDGPTEEVLSVLRRVAAECRGLSLQYTPTAGRTATRRAVAARLADQYALPFDFRDVILTSGAMPALNIVSRALFGPADEVIVLTPAWQDYPLYLRNLNIPVRLVRCAPTSVWISRLSIARSDRGHAGCSSASPAVRPAWCIRRRKSRDSQRS